MLKILFYYNKHVISRFKKSITNIYMTINYKRYIWQ